MEKPSEYGQHAIDYLARAHERLSSSCDRDLFYAAFELRCCIEKRQAAYLSALKSHENSKIKRWKIREISRNLYNVWDDPKIASILFKFDDGLEIQTYYTPVTQSLVIAAERDLGLLLHSIDIKGDKLGEWLRLQRVRLTQTYREAWTACKGQHMAPPLWNASTGECHPFLMIGGDEVRELFERIELDPDGYGKFVVNINYLNEPPLDWTPDL